LWYHQQTEAAAKRRVERAEAFVAPGETAAPTVEEKRKRKRREVEREMDKDERTSEGRERRKKKGRRDDND
jgi:ribosomal RNA assembly protein